MGSTATTAALPTPSHYDAPPSPTRLEKVHRQRRAREVESQRKAEREKREKQAVVRLSARALRRGFALDLLQLDYRYWTLRTCGWDILAPYNPYCVNAAGVACDPGESVVWLWWAGLHYKTRDKLRAMTLEDRADRRMTFLPFDHKCFMAQVAPDATA